MNKSIVIVGAGLSGLYAASLLAEQGVGCRVLEARERIGGRVLTKGVTEKPEVGEYDLGPTWFWPQQEPIISSLVEKHRLKTFIQHTAGDTLLEQAQHAPVQRQTIPNEAMEQSFRLAGGIENIINALSDTLPEGTVELGSSVSAVDLNESGSTTMDVTNGDGQIRKVEADIVIMALPPRIAAQRIALSPSLPADVMSSMMEKPTWMAGQAKVVAIYHKPFWREDGLSGQAMSWVGPLQEIHDASNDTGYGALFGFFGLPAKIRQNLGKSKVFELAVDQFTRLFGKAAEEPIALLFKDWSIDSETALDIDGEPLRAFPNYGGLYLHGPWEKKLFFASTETAPAYGGHLEGALQSAEQAVFHVLG